MNGLICGYWVTSAGRYIPSFTNPSLLYKWVRWLFTADQWEKA